MLANINGKIQEAMLLLLTATVYIPNVLVAETFIVDGHPTTLFFLVLDLDCPAKLRALKSSTPCRLDARLLDHDLDNLFLFPTCGSLTWYSP